MLNLFKSKFRIAIILIICVLSLGVCGYHYVVDYGWVDALYMTVITISTVGFAEVVPLDESGKLFTVGLIAASAITVAYSISVITEYLVNKNSFEEFKKEGVIVEIAPVLKLYRNLLKPKNAIRFLFEIRESIKVADRLNEKYNFDIIYTKSKLY